MTKSITNATISLSDASHKIKKTPVDQVVKEYLRLAELYQENADAYKNAALMWENKSEVKKEYKVKIYSGIVEDSKLEFKTVTKGYPKAIYWITAPGFATIESTDGED